MEKLNITDPTKSSLYKDWICVNQFTCCCNLMLVETRGKVKLLSVIFCGHKSKDWFRVCCGQTEGCIGIAVGGVVNAGGLRGELLQLRRGRLFFYGVFCSNKESLLSVLWCCPPSPYLFASDMDSIEASIYIHSNTQLLLDPIKPNLECMGPEINVLQRCLVFAGECIGMRSWLGASLSYIVRWDSGLCVSVREKGCLLCLWWKPRTN